MFENSFLFAYYVKFRVHCTIKIFYVHYIIYKHGTTLKNSIHKYVMCQAFVLIYKENVLHLDVCYLRLDFETFSTNGPDGSEGDCLDTFNVQVKVV